MRRRIGIGWRPALDPWLSTFPEEVAMLELTAEHFFGGERRATLHQLRRDYPLVVHGLGLSLGTPGPIDRETLAEFVRVADAVDAEWVSDHLAFTRTSEVDLGHLNPIPMTACSLAIVIAHIEEVQSRTGRQLLLENITSHLRLPGDMNEPTFLNAVREATGCGFLLDVTNLFINSRNHGFDPVAWFGQLDPTGVRQLHVVGYTQTPEGYEDFHAAAIQHDLRDLIEFVLARTNPDLILLERDQDFRDIAGLADELRGLGVVHAPA